MKPVVGRVVVPHPARILRDGTVDVYLERSRSLRQALHRLTIRVQAALVAIQANDAGLAERRLRDALNDVEDAR